MASKRSSGGYRVACYAFAALVGVALLLAAFYAGMLIAPIQEDKVANDGVVELDEVEQAEDENDEMTTAPESITDGVQVDWLVEADGDRAFNFYLRRAWESTFPNGAGGGQLVYSAAVLGTVKNADHDGDYLVANTVAWDADSLGGGAATFYTIEQAKADMNPIVLTRYAFNEPSFSTFTSTGEAVSTVIDAIAASKDLGLTLSDASVVGLSPAETLVLDGNAFELVGVGSRHSEVVLAGAREYAVGVSFPDGTTLREFDRFDGFSGQIGTFFTELPDGRLAFYDLRVVTWGDPTVPQMTSVDWDSGSDFPEGYLKAGIGGCGAMNPTNVQYDFDASGLKKTGTLEGHPVYEYADYHNTADYSNWQFTHQENTPSYESFAAMHPSFFLKDGLGRWIKFTGATIIPPGECGKPVIYLYPTETTDLSVTLAPQGGFTKTEPAYGNGWNVTASPNGRLVNKADGLTYPYLFWEGRGGYYSSPTKYWVVANADVHAFLVSTLAKLGLNDAETADFLEFWEPRMQAEPFYKIGFHGTTVMNQIAPLTVSQTPDTLVRILMDYEGLSSPIASNPPVLPETPVRNGFTVIEWGGVIR